MVLMIKCGLVLVAVALWLISQKLLGQKKLPSDQPIGDLVHRWTAGGYEYLQQHPRLANALLIASSLIVDLMGIFLIYQTLMGPTLRPLLGLVLLFGLRQINQAITTLPTPQGMIWHNPGVPSLFVTYDVSNDLFFSGHTALAVFGALELAQLGGLLWISLAVLIVVFEVMVVLLLRAHWTMDVFAGAITALWISQVVLLWAPSVDLWFTKLVGV